MHNNRLNHLMVLRMYQKEIDKVDVQNTTKKAITRKDSRIR